MNKVFFALIIAGAFVAGSILTGAMAYASGDMKGPAFEALWDAIHNLETAVFTAQTCFIGTFMIGINSDGTIVCTDPPSLDIVTANKDFIGVSVLLGDGSGTMFAKTDFAAEDGTEGVAVGDFNNDGDLDIVTANPGSNNVSVLLGDGSGTTFAKTNFAVGTAPIGVAVGEFNP